MFFFAILLGVLLAYLIQMKVYKKHTKDHLSYHLHLSAEEVFQDEDLYFYDEIANDKLLPLPFLKVNDELPQGLSFHFIDPIVGEDSVKESFEQQVQSVYVLQSYQKIRRRWRITCKKRGVYHVGEALLVTNDVFGLNSQSFSASVLPGYTEETVVVLPKPIDLQSAFTAADGLTGDVFSNHSLLTDPLICAGIREYRPGDGMRQINWKSTASHGKYMVNIEEHFRHTLFHIVINMQSRTIEKNPEVPSAPHEIERCISVAATLFDRVSELDIPTRMILNTPQKSLKIHDPLMVSAIDEEDPVGRKIVISRSFEGRAETLDALRMLAGIPMEISVPEEKLLDHILANPTLYTQAADYRGSASLILISAYFSERMIHFHRAMEQLGVQVIYYITSSNRNAVKIPEDIEIYFSVGSILTD
ncbi:MAG: DUF58 domain-containing protein [Clostridia bacterium]|nr:DUF58 domain-containing protein [Clostridia bacterium]